MTTPGTQGEVSPESLGKTASSPIGSPLDAKPASPPTTGNTAHQNRLNLAEESHSNYGKRLKFESQKGNSRLVLFLKSVPDLAQKCFQPTVAAQGR